MEAEKESRKAYYELVHENVKAEFINGEIIYQSPVKKAHWEVSANLSFLLQKYVREHDLGKVAIEKAMVSLSRNDYEPDICFFKKEVANEFDDDQLHFPAPDFVVEILSPSTESIDRNEKFIDYAAHGVKEYWIVDPLKHTIENYILSGNQFQLSEKVKKGFLRSEVISGFEASLNEIFKT